MKVARDRNNALGLYTKSRLNPEGMLPLTWWDKKEYSATAYGTNLLKNMFGELRTFFYPKSVFAVADCLRVLNLEAKDIVLDYFSGSGTTAHSTIMMNREDEGKRKYLLVEMAYYADSVIIPRIKKAVFCEDWKDGKAAGGEGNSHFMKYYQLEQYEDTLRKTRYEDSGLFENPSADPYNQYVFMKDLKMLDGLDVDYKKNKVKVDLSKLYSNIDIPETISNILGSGIKKIGPDYVELQNGDKINTKDLDHKLIKPLIWW